MAGPGISLGAGPVAGAPARQLHQVRAGGLASPLVPSMWPVRQLHQVRADGLALPLVPGLWPVRQLHQARAGGQRQHVNSTRCELVAGASAPPSAPGVVPGGAGQISVAFRLETDSYNKKIACGNNDQGGYPTTGRYG